MTLLGSGVDGEGWHWTLSDFVVMGVLLFVAGFAYEFLASKVHTVESRIAVGLAVGIVLLAVWAQLAVGAVSQFVHLLLAA
jgi:hypothetical protein